ncbi:glycyl-tRNA synthetase [Gregarina niphandrodes]|uniref:Glycyl-tRNA synthetase n=1 Tax=Gregarina niphandrodes TaxID=110365 RepID=A0A023BCI2_GRENI|nr:glycyl-tRNA synthetase [Gregarina niphandrodes]EZG83326.1 glycyl-tRNA synthetase [Gregarina niphandrodes]|eukprot:XP_011128950.1 glycyl-tRNA synthetase [Gregarina niphandrodes]
MLGEKLAEQSGALDNLLRRRFFIAPSFEIYGSAAGLFDFGPNGCAVKNELERQWRRHFVLEEDLMEICGPNLTPHAVLKASGHVDRFQDFMCEDMVTKECFRADKIIEECLSKYLSDAQCPTPGVETRSDAEGKVAKKADYKKGDYKKGDGKKGDDKKGAALSGEQLSAIPMILAKLEGMTEEEMDAVIREYKIRSPVGNDLSKPYPFNLMFATRIGPKQTTDGAGIAYLRPETAQGIFVNFRRLLEQNNGRMPFGGACVGTSFRNEIAPRNGLLRVREFPMAEIEYFCDPLCKSPFGKFESVKNVRVPLFDRESQLSPSDPKPRMMSLVDAVNSKIIDNETLAYFMGRTYLFLVSIGINPEGLRFRQHLETEMAHYASDCWDAEILTSYKWVECVGIADRSAFDLTQHARATKVDLQASRQLPEPRMEERLEVVANRKALGPIMKKDLGELMSILESLQDDEKLEKQQELADTGCCNIQLGDGRSVSVESKYMEITKKNIKVTEEVFIPNVIEPSFGIGRIIQAVFEHAYRQRDAERTFLALSPLIAPFKVAILPISNQPSFTPILDNIRSGCLQHGLSCKVDASGASIGKRYARTDELGIPFALTIDFETLKDQSVTLRELISMEQIRLPNYIEAYPLIQQLMQNAITWDQATQKYGKQ